MNGNYSVFTADGKHQYEVYCQFNANRTGWAFPSITAIGSKLFDVSSMMVERDPDDVESVDVRFLLQYTYYETESLFKPLVSAADAGAQIRVNTSWKSPLPGLDPRRTGHYIYVTIVNGSHSNGTDDDTESKATTMDPVTAHDTDTLSASVSYAEDKSTAVSNGGTKENHAFIVSF